MKNMGRKLNWDTGRLHIGQVVQIKELFLEKPPGNRIPFDT